MDRSARFTALAAAAAATAALFASPALYAKDKPSGEEQLAKLLEGRTAGKPMRCIRDYPSQSMKIIDKTAFVFGRGDTIYVQRTRNPQDIDDDDVLVIRKTAGSGTQLCRLDQITTIDRYSGIFSGALFMTDFVPYKRDKDKAKQ